MAIDALEAVTLCDSTQWIRVRGADASNPVLLLIQQGPGLPMINEVRRFERVLDLERAFTVVYWDQRGCGLSLRGPNVPGGITVEQMIRDTVALLDLLRERFAQKSFVAGFSLGAMVGARAAAVRPDLVEALVAVAMDIDGVAAGTNAYDFALSAARRRGNRRAIRQLTGIGAPPHLTPKQFTTRVRWAANFGGVTSNRTYAALMRELLVSVARAHDYSIADLIRSLRGVSAAQAALLPELAVLDLVRTLPRIGVPIVMVQGRRDEVAPGEAAERYAMALDSPSKQFVWFDNSAHTPHLEEPDQFRDVLMRVRAGRVASRASVGPSNAVQSLRNWEP